MPESGTSWNFVDRSLILAVTCGQQLAFTCSVVRSPFASLVEWNWFEVLPIFALFASILGGVALAETSYVASFITFAAVMSSEWTVSMKMVDAAETTFWLRLDWSYFALLEQWETPRNTVEQRGTPMIHVEHHRINTKREKQSRTTRNKEEPRIKP